MKNKLNIVTYCSIKNNAIVLNGHKIAAKDKRLPFTEFSKRIYKEHNMAYPKFFKMDNLCKLAFLTAEFLFNHVAINAKDKENMAMVLSNKSASLNTDKKHQETINNKENYYPGPAVFVYTLPNITIGEISIRHQIKGESAFFVSDAFNSTLLEHYAMSLLQNKKTNHVLCGWADFDNGQYHAFMYIVAHEGNYKYTQEFINKFCAI